MSSERIGNDQCCGSMTFWRGSGSEDPCFLLMDPDQDSDADPEMDADRDPPIIVIDLQDANKKQIWLKIFLLITF
jgi:hypothetical protein